MHDRTGVFFRTVAALAVATALAGCSETPRTIATWGRAFGVSGTQVSQSVAVGADGNVVFTGAFGGSVDFGGGALQSAGGDDVFIASLDATGAARWSGRSGSVGGQAGASLAIAPNGDIMASGAFTGTVSFGGQRLHAGVDTSFLVRFDAYGNTLWTKQLGDGVHAVRVAGVAVGLDGSIVLGGDYVDEASFGGTTLANPGQTAFIARFDANGDHVFSLGFGGSNHQVTAVAVDPLGDVVAVGWGYGPLDLGGPPLQSSGQSAFIAKLDRTGRPQWLAQLASDNGGAPANALAVDGAGNIYFAGAFNSHVTFGRGTYTAFGGRDAYVAKLSPLGEALWFAQFGGQNALASGVAADVAGHVIFTGSYYGNIDFGGGPLSPTQQMHVFLAELDTTGRHVRSDDFHGSVDDQPSAGTAVALDPAGAIVVTGWLRSDLAVGGKPLTSASDQAVFVAHLAR